MASSKKRANTNLMSHEERNPLDDISNKRSGMVRLEKSTKIVSNASQENSGPCKGTRLQRTKTQQTQNPVGITNSSAAAKKNTLEHRNQPSVLVSSGRESLDFMDVDDFDEVFPGDVKDIDSEDHSEPLFVSLYVNEIYSFLRTNEVKYKPTQYMVEQADISASMRSILIDWLVEVAEEYKLASETLYLCVNYLDRFLSRKIVNRSQLQLLGIVCMLIASKFEEIYAPAVDEFVYISDNTYSKEEMFEMEETVLATLKFHLCAPTIKTFLRRYLKAASASSEVTSLANLLCELTLQDYTFTKYLSSMIALSAVCLSLHSFGFPCWSTTLEFYSGYKCNIKEMKECVQDLFTLYSNIGGSPLQAIKEKYSHPKYFKVSCLRPPSTLPPFVNS